MVQKVEREKKKRSLLPFLFASVCDSVSMMVFVAVASVSRNPTDGVVRVEIHLIEWSELPTIPIIQPYLVRVYGKSF